jgi:hypothetical protein
LAEPAAPKGVHPTESPLPPPTLRIDSTAPPCEDIYVYIVTDWVDGEAMATIAQGINARGYPKRIGARVGEYEVVAIGPTFGNGPAVWLAKGEDVCRARLFDDNPKRAKARGKRSKSRRHRKRKKRKKRKRRRRR